MMSTRTSEEVYKKVPKIVGRVARIRYKLSLSTLEGELTLNVRPCNAKYKIFGSILFIK